MVWTDTGAPGSRALTAASGEKEEMAKGEEIDHADPGAAPRGPGKDFSCPLGLLPELLPSNFSRVSSRGRLFDHEAA